MVTFDNIKVAVNRENGLNRFYLKSTFKEWYENMSNGIRRRFMETELIGKRYATDVSYRFMHNLEGNMYTNLVEVGYSSDKSRFYIVTFFNQHPRYAKLNFAFDDINKKVYVFFENERDAVNFLYHAATTIEKMYYEDRAMDSYYSDIVVW